jgi:ATP-dependent Clp protease ATP-binding subunit ClpA
VTRDSIVLGDRSLATKVLREEVGELPAALRPEALLHALDHRHIESIAKIQLKVLEARLAKMDLQLDVSPPALAELAKAGFDPVFGARPLKRAIQERIENPLSKAILEGRFGPKDTVFVSANPAGHLVFDKNRGAEVGKKGADAA